MNLSNCLNIHVPTAACAPASYAQLVQSIALLPTTVVRAAREAYPGTDDSWRPQADPTRHVEAVHRFLGYGDC